ncbi:MAG: FkbM family methyltransferase [Planctomycetes bacterium]|nr:FkbM family methyltransferase [Planctomycetota bacterium]
MNTIQLVHNAWDRVPKVSFKDFARRLVQYVAPKHLLRSSRWSDAMLAELALLEVAQAGVSDGNVPYITLTDGPSFYGNHATPMEVFRYRCLPRVIRQKFPRSCIRVALDIVLRYAYAHAEAYRTPPVHPSLRAEFHLNHQDTINDLESLTHTECQELARRFEISQGDVVIDGGAFIGFGALKYSRLVGSEGRIIAFEADPDNQRLFDLNMNENQISNVTLIRRALWETVGTMSLNQAGRQANSVIDQIVQGGSSLSVQTDTIDSVVDAMGLEKVSLISLTINGAELEAIRGMHRTLKVHKPNLVVAGWYKRDGEAISDLAAQELESVGYQTVIGLRRRLYAWVP